MNSARFFWGWSKEGASKRVVESDVASVLIHASPSASRATYLWYGVIIPGCF